MAKKQKTPDFVIDAEAKEASAKIRFESLKREADAAELAWLEAKSEVAAAKKKADKVLPQCEMVSVARYSGKETSCGSFVIVKKTPTGILVVRKAGITGMPENRFKKSQHDGVFRDTAKSSMFLDRRELRGVPAEFQ